MLDTEWLLCLRFWYHCTVHGEEETERDLDGMGEFQLSDV